MTTDAAPRDPLDAFHLAEWLRDTVPGDLPIPCDPRKKCPLFRHASGVWTWPRARAALFDATRPGGALRDEECLGLLLNGLCVVDVDDRRMARDLCDRFPAMERAPCVRTRRGYHFYFVRSRHADEAGFFDGAAQVRAYPTANRES